nr:MAG TPA: hypothetical protein [Caudoviricetes sp.]
MKLPLESFPPSSLFSLISLIEMLLPRILLDHSRLLLSQQPLAILSLYHR